MVYLDDHSYLKLLFDFWLATCVKILVITIVWYWILANIFEHTWRSKCVLLYFLWHITIGHTNISKIIPIRATPFLCNIQLNVQLPSLSEKLNHSILYSATHSSLWHWRQISLRYLSTLLRRRMRRTLLCNNSYCRHYPEYRHRCQWCGLGIWYFSNNLRLL